MTLCFREYGYIFVYVSAEARLLVRNFLAVLKTSWLYWDCLWYLVKLSPLLHIPCFRFQFYLTYSGEYLSELPHSNKVLL